MRFLIAFVALAAAIGAGLQSLASPAFGPHVMYAIVRHVNGAELVVQRHSGQLEVVDIRAARSNGRTGVLYVSRAVALYGEFDRVHHYHVNAIMSSYGIERGVWPADR